MAHNIVNNMLSYKGVTPWHGLGVNVEETATGMEMLVKAGMNWQVQRRAIAMRGDLTNPAIDPTVMVKEPLSGFRAIVRSDNDHVFQVSTDRYQIVQNAEVVEIFREYCEAGHASMETVGALEGGNKVWALARLNGGSTATLAGGDELRGYMLFATSHDGSLRTIAKPTQIRVVCANTMSIALGDGVPMFKLKHSAKFTEARKEEARVMMGMASQQVAKTNAAAEALSHVNIDHSDWLDFMGKLLGPDAVLDTKNATLSRMASDIQDATLTSPGSTLTSAKGTLWGAVNGVTFYTDHMRGRTQDTRLASAWFGDSDLLKRTAMNTALEMADVSI